MNKKFKRDEQYALSIVIDLSRPLTDTDEKKTREM